MTERRAWYVTPTTDAAANPRRLAGPFTTRAACERECVVLCDRATAERALAQGKLPWPYVPRLLGVPSVGASFIQSRTRASAVPTRAVPEAPRAALPAAAYTYTEADLCVLCRALGITPPTHTSRQAIIEHLEREVAKLQRVPRP